ncbi:MAG: PAS domain S-box protein [Bacteroidetes bacterium]|nr:PAS domain S-box protein [Bacteroidota bacterium]
MSRLDVAQSCIEAQDRIGTGRTYDIAFVDLDVRDGDALQFISSVRNGALPTRVVALVSCDEDERATPALKAGADYYIVKSDGHQKEWQEVLAEVSSHLISPDDSEERICDVAKSIHVLYAKRKDDRPDSIQQYLSRCVPLVSLEVLEANDQLINRVDKQENPDLLLLDYDFLGSRTFKIVRDVRRVCNRRVPIVIAVSEANEEDVAQAIKLGADDCVVKSNAFLHRVPRVLENAALRSSIAHEQTGLKRSEERYRKISGLISHYAYVFDVTAEGKLASEWISESFERKFGYTRPEVEDRGGWQSLTHVDDVTIVSEHIKRMLAGASDQAEFRFVTRSGEVVWLRDCAEPVWDDARSRVAKVYGASQDLTEQKSAENELRRAETRLMEMADSLPQPLIEVDIFGKVTFANRVAFEFMATNQEDFEKGSFLFDFVSSSEHERAIDSFGAILRGEKIEPRQYTIVRKDGSTRPVIVSATRIARGSEIVGMRIVLLDMTQINTIQEAVKASENRYRLLFENSADELFILDEDGVFLQVNQAASDKLGYSREEILGQKMSMILPEVIRGEEKIRIDRIFRDGEGTFESMHLKKDGSAIPVEVHGRSITLDDKETILLAARDLTERKKAEAAVRESEEKFKNLVESSLVGVYIIQDGKFAYVNPALSKIFMYTQDELIAMPSLAAGVIPEDRERVLDRMKMRLEKAPESSKYFFHAARKDGAIIELETLGSRTIFKGRPAIIGTLEEVTERRKAEEKLRESEARYRDLFENSVDAIYLSTPSGKLLDINPAGVKLFGFSSKEELLNVDDISVFYESKGDRAVFEHTLAAKGVVRDFEVRIKRNDGQKLTVLDTASVVLDEKSQIVGYHGILRDLTEKRKLEEQLFQSQKLESLGQLTSGIAHDFNNVLGGIMGFTELATEKTSDDSVVHGYLTKIYKLAERAAKITRQLLAFARRQILMQRDMNLNELIGDLFELLPRLLGEHVQTRFIPGENLKTVRADPSQIEQVLLNLSVNASDAMPQGGMLIIETGNAFLDESYCALHANVQPGEYVVVSVSDTGAGMDDSTLQRIFEPFFTTKAVGKGTGLGLAVVHGIIQQHGGSVNVYSEVGRGTTFKIYFPAVSQAAEKLNNQPRGAGRLMTGTETVLVVEDNEELREFMKTLLTERGYTVLTANDGEEGAAVFEQNAVQISLVITDVVMPKMSGGELREKILAAYPGKKFMLISGYPGHAINHGFLLDSRVDFLQKPFTAFEFAEKVRRTIDKPTARSG